MIHKFQITIVRTCVRCSALLRFKLRRRRRENLPYALVASRDDNPGIRRIVLENGFQHVGEKWRSVENLKSLLMLWLRR
jgi:hypothetical protein